MTVHVERSLGRRWVRRAALFAVFAACATAAHLSAHGVVGVVSPTLATAFVSSPSVGTDKPIKVLWDSIDTGLRVACFNAANTSTPRLDQAGWPRVTAVGFELPGRPSGFSLIEPLDDEWELVEGEAVEIPNRGRVVLDFAIVTRANRKGSMRGKDHHLAGLPPGQAAVRGSGTRFCVSGPFPDRLPDVKDPAVTVDTTIELLINGVVVTFDRVEGRGPSRDFGLWNSVDRRVPLYPQARSANAFDRTLKGSCETTIAPVEPANAGACAVFQPVPSAFAQIDGTCQLTHLGRSTTHTVQQLLFALNSQGQPIIVNGQPVITGLRNCATFTAANGDMLRHTTIGTVAPGSVPGTVVFNGDLVFSGGTGRFADASGVGTFEGDASLITNTGRLEIDGRLTY